MQRPPLPVEHVNPHIKTIDVSKPPAVKFQEIIRDGQATVVGRIKIPTPTGHAFILRRLDTGAISLTTMFRAAFPTASEESERQEAAWVKANYDTSGANKSGKARFAGTWVTPDVAVSLAEGYSLAPIIAPLADAIPDPNIVYRKSSKTQQQQQPTPTTSPVAHAAPSEAGPGPAKRRRESSPVRSPASVPLPASPAVAPSTTSKIPLSTTKRGATPTAPTRRSTRMKSPAPAPLPLPVTSPRTPRTKAVRQEVRTTGGSDETIVDDEAALVVKSTEPNMHDDIREQKELIERLKSEREVARVMEEVDELMQEEEAGPAQKRAREDEEHVPGYTLNIKEPEVEERAIATNKRVRLLGQMPPERKSLAWGAVFFAAGLGAVSFLPSLSGFF